MVGTCTWACKMGYLLHVEFRQRSVKNLLILLILLILPRKGSKSAHTINEQVVRFVGSVGVIVRLKFSRARLVYPIDELNYVLRKIAVV